MNNALLRPGVLQTRTSRQNQPKRRTIGVLVTGATASGKTALAHSLWREGDRIVNADSRQVFKGLDLGTDKPKRNDLRHYNYSLVDELEGGSSFSAYDFARRAEDILRSGASPVQTTFLVGGASLYVMALLKGLPMGLPSVGSERTNLAKTYETMGLKPFLEELAEKDADYYAQVDKRNPVRVLRAVEVIRTTGMTFTAVRQRRRPASSRLLVLVPILPRAELYKRINDRVCSMVREGLIDEVDDLLSSGVSRSFLLKTIGYREVVLFLEGGATLEECVAGIQRSTRLLAKRQLSWVKNNLSEALFVAQANPDDDTGDVAKEDLWWRSLPVVSSPSNVDSGEVLTALGGHKRMLWEGPSKGQLRRLIDDWQTSSA